jgi:hypothetical protein
MPASFFQSQHILVKRNRLLEIGDAVTSVQKLFDHDVSIARAGG